MFRSLSYTLQKDWSVLNVSIKLMGLMVAFKYAGIGLMDPFFSLFLESLGHNYTAVGELTSLFGFASLVTTIPLIRVADHIQNKLVVWRGLQGYAVAVLFYFLAAVYQHLFFLIMALIIHGVSYTMVDGGSEAYVRKHATFDHTSRAFGYLSSIRNSGWIIGILVGGLLFPYLGFAGLFLLMIPFMLINSFFVHSIEERGVTSLLAAAHRYFSHFKDLFRLFRDFHQFGPQMIFSYGLIFFDGLQSVLLATFLPLFAFTLSLSYTEIAFLMAVVYLPSLFSFFFAEIADRMNRIDLIVAGLMIVVTAFLFLFSSTEPHWIMIFASVISLGMALVKPAYNGLISDLAPHHMLGEISSIQMFVARSSAMICPFLFGILADFYAIRFTFLFAALAAFVLIFAAFAIKMYHYFNS